MSKSSERIPISKKVRFEVFKRDSFTCRYCGKCPPAVMLAVDHVLPVCQGGGNDMDNLATSCVECNQGKGGASISQSNEPESTRMARMQEHMESVEAARLAAEASKARDDLREVAEKLLKRLVWNDERLKPASFTHICNRIKEFGPEVVMGWFDNAEFAFKGQRKRQDDVCMYINGCARRTRERMAAS